MLECSSYIIPLVLSRSVLLIQSVLESERLLGITFLLILGFLILAHTEGGLI